MLVLKLEAKYSPIFGWSEFEPSPHTAIGSCTGVSVLVLTCGLTKCFWINSKTCISLMVTDQDLAHSKLSF